MNTLTTVSLSLLSITGFTLYGAQLASGPRAAGPLLTPEQAEILSHLSLVHLSDGQGGTLPTLRVTGVNVQLLNGLGATNGNPADPYTVDVALTVTNGLGNLILGYGEAPLGGDAVRDGSHNLVVGAGHEYRSFGGAVLGRQNEITGPGATVVGGAVNQSTGVAACVSGGSNNLAQGQNASVAGGAFNWATGSAAFVGGGSRSAASGATASVSGGYKSVASGELSSVTGGDRCRASGPRATASGGSEREATGFADWVAGTLFEDQ